MLEILEDIPRKPNGNYLAWVIDPPAGLGLESEWYNVDKYSLEQMSSSVKGANTSLSLLELLNKEQEEIWEQSPSINNGLPYLKNNKP